MSNTDARTNFSQRESKRMYDPESFKNLLLEAAVHIQKIINSTKSPKNSISTVESQRAVLKGVLENITNVVESYIAVRSEIEEGATSRAQSLLDKEIKSAFLNLVAPPPSKDPKNSEAESANGSLRDAYRLIIEQGFGREVTMADRSGILQADAVQDAIEDEGYRSYQIKGMQRGIRSAGAKKVSPSFGENALIHDSFNTLYKRILIIVEANQAKEKK